MRKLIVVVIVVVILAAAVPVSVSAYDDDCWGQATAAFARMGKMGEHASQQEEPRDGLHLLAVYYYEEGVIDAPTVQALAALLVAIDPDLTVEACMN